MHLFSSSLWTSVRLWVPRLYHHWAWPLAEAELRLPRIAAGADVDCSGEGPALPRCAHNPTKQHSFSIITFTRNRVPSSISAHRKAAFLWYTDCGLPIQPLCSGSPGLISVVLSYRSLETALSDPMVPNIFCSLNLSIPSIPHL